MYCTINFKTKKELKEAVAAGRKITVFDPGFKTTIPSTGRISVEGPHYPQPHKWYAEVELVNQVIVKVK